MEMPDQVFPVGSAFPEQCITIQLLVSHKNAINTFIFRKNNDCLLKIIVASVVVAGELVSLWM